MAKKVYWLGDVKASDDFGDEITTQFIDGRTNRGPWGIMTPANHVLHGVGLGTGLGQLYRLQADGRWLKVEG